MLNWPIYALVNGWLIDEGKHICPEQLKQFKRKATPNDAEIWMARNDIRGSVLGSSWRLPNSRDHRNKR